MSDWRALAETVLRDEAPGTIGTKGTKAPSDTTSVPIVPNVPAPINARAVLREWHSRLEPLGEAPPPADYDPAWWRQAVEDAWWVYENFCSQAVRAGWSALDLFGVLPFNPKLGGLVPRLAGARNLKIEGNKAVWSHYGLRDWTCAGAGDGLLSSGIVLLWNLAR